MIPQEKFGLDYFQELNRVSKESAAARANLHFVDFQRLAQMAQNRTTWIDRE